MLTKKQREMLMKAFRILRAGIGEAEAATDNGLSPETILEHVRTMQGLTTKMVAGLEGHIGAEPLLLHVAEKRPSTRAPTGRPKSKHLVPNLRLVK